MNLKAPVAWPSATDPSATPGPWARRDGRTSQTVVTGTTSPIPGGWGEGIRYGYIIPEGHVGRLLWVRVGTYLDDALVKNPIAGLDTPPTVTVGGRAVQLANVDNPWRITTFAFMQGTGPGLGYGVCMCELDMEPIDAAEGEEVAVCSATGQNFMGAGNDGWLHYGVEIWQPEEYLRHARGLGMQELARRYFFGLFTGAKA